MPESREYPVTDTQDLHGRAAAVDLRSDPTAREFRTRIGAALEKGPNFAGHFVIATWGCGTMCLAGAVVDSRTGRVFPGDTAIDFSCRHEFQRTSRLLIIYAPDSATDYPEECRRVPPGYFLWADDHFERVVPR